MAAPIVTYYDENGTNPVTQWDIGEIDAGTESAHLKFTVWNNKGGDSDVSNMKNVTITTKTQAGDDTSGPAADLIAGTWINVKINEEATFQNIGGSSNCARLYAIGIDPNTDGYTILGTINDGTKANSTSNYADIEVYADVPMNATEGQRDFVIRTQYSYT